MAKGFKEFRDYKTIKTTSTVYEKKGSRWKQVEKTNRLFSEKQYDNFTDPRWSRHNRYLGGYEKAESRYTKRGYRVVKNTSISPGRDTKIVTEFNFKDSDKLYDRALMNYRKQFSKRRK